MKLIQGSIRVAAVAATVVLVRASAGCADLADVDACRYTADTICRKFADCGSAISLDTCVKSTEHNVFCGPDAGSMAVGPATTSDHAASASSGVACADAIKAASCGASIASIAECGSASWIPSIFGATLPGTATVVDAGGGCKTMACCQLQTCCASLPVASQPGCLQSASTQGDATCSQLYQTYVQAKYCP